MESYFLQHHIGRVGDMGGKPAEISGGQGECGRNALVPDRTTDEGGLPLLFPAENAKRSGKGVWGQ